MAQTIRSDRRSYEMLKAQLKGNVDELRHAEKGKARTYQPLYHALVRQLNGCTGVITGYNSSSGRFAVEISEPEGSEVAVLRPEREMNDPFCNQIMFVRAENLSRVLQPQDVPDEDDAVEAAAAVRRLPVTGLRASDGLPCPVLNLAHQRPRCNVQSRCGDARAFPKVLALDQALRGTAADDLVMFVDGGDVAYAGCGGRTNPMAELARRLRRA